MTDREARIIRDGITQCGAALYERSMELWPMPEPDWCYSCARVCIADDDGTCNLCGQPCDRRKGE